MTPRLGRYKSLDPLAASFPWNSPFAYAENRVIDGLDLEGREYIRFDKVADIGNSLLTYYHNNGGLGFPVVEYKGNKYYNLGFHLKNPNSEQITEWVYTPITPVIPKDNFVNWSTKNDCYANCQEQLGKQGNSSDAYWPSAFQMFKQGNSGKGVTDASKLAGLDALHRAVEGGGGIMVGVDYGATTSDDKNLDKTTDHFITIVGRGSDDNGEFFTFYENAVNDKDKGTDVSTNRLYIQSDGTLKGNTSWGSNITFTVTQVRPNKEDE
ncbi:hypothetical protein [Acidiluteibacter ferrifornacis]|uniref:RHS repeat-associated core domain-containing protein n=1 Tax=Acidiluteibacter ferrifornacis TaxID=2692424 RepID=A0A6N9NEM9_9FLAO|nr:hypothetical protein [Acidiluteibacter ferrifornacis]NBG65086.1 hypothetical protein [Acidiluteibacter ferrifornacis]